MKGVVAVLFVSSAVPLAQAAEWSELLLLPKLRIEQDQDSLRADGNVVSAWQRWTYDQDQVFSGKSYRVGRYLIHSDCERNTRANAHVELLDDKGVIVFSRKPPVFVFAPLLPDSIPEAVHKKICAAK